MESTAKNSITVSVRVHAPIEKVWETWTHPDDIIRWNNASQDWHTPRAENDLTAGGKFSYRMEARDGSMGFDFRGVYDNVIKMKQIDYTMGDSRKASITFSASGETTEIVETFEAETTNTIELQRTGWQAILDNFKKYTEEK
ncbi:MAG: SRPBCC family protein [Bacteroidia bacterium]|nr:SRPBCC family protein [Bacteroidia bacterium]